MPTQRLATVCVPFYPVLVVLYTRHQLLDEITVLAKILLRFDQECGRRPGPSTDMYFGDDAESKVLRETSRG
jgi:hypothetical protein